MADVFTNTAAIKDALNQSFRRLVPQRNLATNFLSFIRKERNVTGKNVSWAFKFGSDEGAEISEGSNQTAFNAETKLPATLDTQEVSEGFKITQKAMNAAFNSAGPEGLTNLYAGELQDAVGRLAAKLNKLVIYGNAGVIGLLNGTTGAIGSTGTYGGPSRATYPTLAGNLRTNPLGAGTPRDWSLIEMRQLRRTIYKASGRKPSAIWTGPLGAMYYGELLGDKRRYIQDVTIAGKKYTLDGGYQALEFDGVPVLEDKDMEDSGSGWNAKAAFLDMSTLCLRYQPDVAVEGAMPLGYVTIMGTPEEHGISGGTGLVARLNKLASSGNHHLYQLIVEVQLENERPNASGVLDDLPTT